MATLQTSMRTPRGRVRDIGCRRAGAQRDRSAAHRGTAHQGTSPRCPGPRAPTIANSGSTDQTGEVARELVQTRGVHVVSLERPGHGRAVGEAWRTSHATVLAYVDVDLSTDLSALRARSTDAQCGFTTQSDADHALLHCVEDQERFFDTELLVLAQHSDLRILDMGVHDRGRDPLVGRAHVLTLSRALLRRPMSPTGCLAGNQP